MLFHLTESLELKVINFHLTLCWLVDSANAVSTSQRKMVVGEGFEPSKSLTADLQSAPFGRSGTPPNCVKYLMVPATGIELVTY